MLTILGSVVNITGGSFNDYKNPHFDNELDIHELQNYDECG